MANIMPPTSSSPARSEPPIIGLSSTSQSQPLDENNPLSPTLDADPDIDMNIGTSPNNDDPEGGEKDVQPWDNAEEDAETEVKLPTKKDISLKEFLAKMDDYAPIIPDALTAHHLALAGLPPNETPLALSRLLALATQKFVADIAADAYQYSRMRSSGGGASGAGAAASGGANLGPGATGAGGTIGGGAAGGGGGERGKGAGAHVLGVQRSGYGGGGGGGQGRAVLTMEDLGCAVGEYGVNVRRGEFYR
ncbi:MAG: hypothetical protein Q9214_003601 [Letrouitia sp. 1 TL-2023]